jgi:hypothetical protein
VESVLNRLYDRGVGPQLLLDRGDTFLSDSYCVGSGLFSMVAIRSVSTVLDLNVEPVIYRLCVFPLQLTKKDSNGLRF